jgi:hypothetical protein
MAGNHFVVLASQFWKGIGFPHLLHRPSETLHAACLATDVTFYPL